LRRVGATDRFELLSGELDMAGRSIRAAYDLRELDNTNTRLTRRDQRLKLRSGFVKYSTWLNEPADRTTYIWAFSVFVVFITVILLWLLFR
jgi:hypothetical protein